MTLNAIEYIHPPEAPEPTRPRRAGLWSEWRVVTELARLGLAWPRLRRLPRGDGSTVVLIPGYKSPEAAMGPLRRFLHRLGWDARHWGLGTNQGDPEGDSERLAPLVTRLAQDAGRPVHLIGWSLGGVIARETARLVPDDVAGVVTYGTPVVGGPTYTLAAPVWGPAECARIARLTAEYDGQRPLRVPITAIFTRRDEVVSWPACIDRTSLDVRHFEVRSTHLGLGLDPAVWTVVARRLAASPARRETQSNSCASASSSSSTR